MSPTLTLTTIEDGLASALGQKGLPLVGLRIAATPALALQAYAVTAKGRECPQRAA
jgi:hypothetical protein